MDRTDIIKYLISTYKHKSYLEIGTEHPQNNFDKITIDKKHSIDPYPSGDVTFRLTSDDFFEQLSPTIKYDIVFVDGLHTGDQVYRDIINSLKHLNDGGTIVCHDMNPPSELHASNPRDPDAYNWNGDCYKAWIKLRATRNDLDMAVVEADWGTGVIRVGKQDLIDCDYDNIEYYELEENRNEYLNLISEAEFWDKYR